MADSPTPLTAHRRRELLRILQRTGEAHLTDLASELEVSIATVRRDVTELERRGLLARRRGLAVLDGDSATRLPRVNVGVVVAQNPYLLLIADAVRREAHRRNLGFVQEVVAMRAPTRDARTAFRRLLAAGCTGVLYAPQWSSREEIDEPVPWLQGSGVPVVLTGREVEMGHPLFGLDSVSADHRYAMRLAVEHLSALGHRRIVASIHARVTPTHRLASTFVSELARLGLPLLAPPMDTPVGPEPDMRPVIEVIRSTGATAIVVHTEVQARILAQQLRASGVRVPHQVSIVGYDDIVGPVDRLALTTVSPPKHELGHEALAVLLRRHVRATAGVAPPPVAHVLLLPELAVRASTAPPQQAA